MVHLSILKVPLNAGARYKSLSSVVKRKERSQGVGWEYPNISGIGKEVVGVETDTVMDKAIICACRCYQTTLT